MIEASARDVQVVACLGSSSTAGKGQAFDWIGELSRRPGNRRFSLLNLGVDGDLAFNALARLDDVVERRPQKVIVWIGGNDALAMVFERARRYYRFAKHLPRDPSVEYFAADLHAIVQGLKRNSITEIALCSLSPIGENLDSDDVNQRALNNCIKQLSTAIAEVARQESCAYIPIYEELFARIKETPGKSFSKFRFFQFLRDGFRFYFLHMTPDQIGEKNGYRFHSDGIHLNNRAGLIAAELIQKYLDS